MRRRWWLAALFSAGLGGAFYWASAADDGAAGDVGARAAAYAARIGLPLPPGTRAEFARWMNGIDAATQLALVMPDAGWAAIRSRLPPRPFEAASNASFGPDNGAWAPKRVPGLVSASFPWRGEAEVILLGVAPAGPGEVRVFVFWHQL